MSAISWNSRAGSFFIASTFIATKCSGRGTGTSLPGNRATRFAPAIMTSAVCSSTYTKSTRVFGSYHGPSRTTMSASFPFSIDPTRSETRAIFAALIVRPLSASSSGTP